MEVQACVCLYFSFQLKAKRSECNSKATHTRNEYLLTLAAANAHQRHYYDTDLINCIKVRMWTLDTRRKTWGLNWNVCLFVGVGWSDLHTGEGLPGVALSDRAGWLPDCWPNLWPPCKSLQRRESLKCSKELRFKMKKGLASRILRWFTCLYCSRPLEGSDVPIGAFIFSFSIFLLWSVLFWKGNDISQHPTYKLALIHTHTLLPSDTLLHSGASGLPRAALHTEEPDLPAASRILVPTHRLWFGTFLCFNSKLSS